MKYLILLFFFTSCSLYSTAILERKSRTGYLPTEYVTVTYSDTMKIGNRIWYDGKMWTLVKLQK